ncbi:MAG: hypothetical protein ACR2P4_01150 [Gammaproteobacteria bacterium]
MISANSPQEDMNMTTIRRFLTVAPALAVAAALLIMGGCGEKPGPKLREVERVNKMSDDEIRAAREQCHIIATSDYNCSELVHPAHGMTPEEWKVLTESTKECRKNQILSFQHCLRGKGVIYAEYD